LKGSIESFTASPFIDRVFGAEFKTHYALSRQAEIDAFDSWMAAQITDFEFQRYFIGT
jgi:glutamine synthetase